jgi:hypothetical protein
LSLGTFDLRQGANVVYLYLVGADPKAEGQGMDLLELIFEKR